MTETKTLNTDGDTRATKPTTFPSPSLSESLLVPDNQDSLNRFLAFLSPICIKYFAETLPVGVGPGADVPYEADSPGYVGE